jgi:hypothetical protein
MTANASPNLVPIFKFPRIIVLLRFVQARTSTRRSAARCVVRGVVLGVVPGVASGVV